MKKIIIKLSKETEEHFLKHQINNNFWPTATATASHLIHLIASAAFKSFVFLIIWKRLCENFMTYFWVPKRCPAPVLLLFIRIYIHFAQAPSHKIKCFFLLPFLQNKIVYAVHLLTFLMFSTEIVINLVVSFCLFLISLSYLCL